ncbi:PDZ domain-containing protein [Pallidibacillus pasinlerensis]|uniref:PDZ domain-containing protein n=1 Tax=Pallidibacillus pasinlerensis TaxID=2703818 RepID=A0ABX0AAM4_9BACI|nr:PDZ domain-containing protein [Pallidibacillus pasinlerensis]NCU18142.1 PDZ domain-containing protein [Pallidibacillus pasinlerensis]
MEWIIELGIGIGKFFLNPLPYLGILFAVYLGYIRVKRERKNFTIRVQDGLFEFRTYLKKGVLLGFIFSLVTLLIGLTVPLAYIITLTVVTVILSIFLRPSALSAAYTLGSTFFIMMAIEYSSFEMPYLQGIFDQVETAIIPGAALLTGLLLMIEGILVFKNASEHTSPKLIRSKRGLTVGIHETKRLWLVPMLVLIPADALTIPFDFWPIFPTSSGGFTFLFVPFWLGFDAKIRSRHPKQGIQVIGRNVILLGAFVSIISAVGFWYPLASICAVGIAMVGRLLISILSYVKDDAQIFYFSRSNEGIVVLDIIPGSPADKMELQIGDVIRTVNGVHVQSTQQFYEAVQLNRAFCKLEVIDDQGENRLVNRALYEGEHHELGVITFEIDSQWEKKDIG